MTIRLKIFALAVVLLLILVISVAVSTFLQREATEEVGGIAEYHVPITATVSEIDVLTFEYELIVLRLLSGSGNSQNALSTALSRQEQIAARLRENFERADELLESAIQDSRNDLSDRLVFARIDAEIEHLEQGTEPFIELGKQVLQAYQAERYEEANRLTAGFWQYEDRYGPDLARVTARLSALTEDSASETFAQQVRLYRFSAVQLLIAALLGLGISAFVANRLVRSLRQLLSAAKAVEAGDLSVEVTAEGKDEAAQLTEAFNRMTEQLRSVRRIKEKFGQYIDPRIVDKLIDPTAADSDLAERRVVTVFFSDIKGFTTIGEQLTAARLAKLLNQYFTRVAGAIGERNGIIDKYIGDAVMAFWTPPFSAGESHASEACMSALEQQKALIDFRRQLPEILGLRREVPDFEVRMGLATGEVLLGTLGSPTAKSYTVIGDVVNLASRLEGINKLYGTAMIAAEETVRLARNTIETRELDRVAVAGKREPIRIFELMGPAGGLDDKAQELREAFHSSLQLYRQRRWDDAEKSFSKCLEITPHDGPSLLLRQRVQELRRHDPGEDWDGVWRLDKK